MIMTGQNGDKMSHHKSNENVIALLDSSTSIDKIKKIVSKTSKIITFDYASHKMLLKNKIKHEISDNYISKLELNEIQNKSYQFSKWAELPHISNLLEYKGFNLGNFFYHEIFIYFLPMLKKLLEVNTISQNFKNYHFFCSANIEPIASLFNESCESIHKKNQKANEFFDDSIKLQNNFFGLKISRTNYFRLKKILEKCISGIFGPKKNSYSNGILFVEFNTNMYGSLFLRLNEKKQKIFFYGRKRPAIWNSNSFSIIKKSNCKIITEDNLSTKNLRDNIRTDSKKLIPKIISMLKNNKSFDSFFSIYEISFWNLIKPFFLDLCERRMKEAIREINLAKTLLEKFHPKCILVLSEIGYTEQFVINQAKYLKVPIILVQHGLFAYDSPESNAHNEFLGSMPLLSNEFIGWGNAVRKYFEQFGISKDKIKILGSIGHDLSYKKKETGLKLKKEFILLATGFATHEHVMDYTIEAIKEYEHALRLICQTILKNKKKLVIKIHPYVQSNFEEKIVKEIDPNISVLRKSDMLSLIESSELIITLAMTSAILDAQIFEKPVVRVPIRNRFGSVDTFRSSPGLTVPITDFENILNKILNDSNFYNQVTKDGKKFVNDCLLNQGNAAENIANFLKNYT